MLTEKLPTGTQQLPLTQPAAQPLLWLCREPIALPPAGPGSNVATLDDETQHQRAQPGPPLATRARSEGQAAPVAPDPPQGQGRPEGGAGFVQRVEPEQVRAVKRVPEEGGVVSRCRARLRGGRLDV